MKFKAASRLLGCLFLFAQAWAAGAALPDEGSNPYAVISERNVFHLNPIPPPEPVAETRKEELPTIKLSGFLKIGKTTHALFSCSPKDKKEEPTYFNLTDGEKSGILEVVKIHEDQGEVEIMNSGKLQTLSLKNDSLEATAPAPNKGAPRGPKIAGVPGNMPGRAAYRFPVAGQGGGGSGPPGIPMPARRTRVQQ